LVSGHWVLLVNSNLVRWNFVNDDIDMMYCPSGHSINDIYVMLCATLEEKVLLETFKGLTAVAKFVAEDSKQQSLVSHSGVLDPHSSQLVEV
jgi:hypothetical protein